MRVAIDAMGGDYAPRTVVQGAVEAARLYGRELEVLLVGRRREILAEFQQLNASADALGMRIVAASEVVGMEESPSQALRQKKDSSIRVAADLVARGEADGVLSAGNTGASVATMLFVIGPMKGVDRPSLGASLPTLKGRSLLLDVGATVDCKPHQLMQFAVMGESYVRHVYGISQPRVGLLSIGEEESKGNQVTKEVHKLLKASPLNFIGNIEGRDIYEGAADVLVCDGFAGNLVLKTSESIVSALDRTVRWELEGSRLMRLGFLLARRSLARLYKRWDYTEVGGAPMLGLNAACIICHGRSNAKSIRSGLGVAREFIKTRVNDTIQERLEEMSRLAGRPSRSTQDQA